MHSKLDVSYKVLRQKRDPGALSWIGVTALTEFVA